MRRHARSLLVMAAALLAAAGCRGRHAGGVRTEVRAEVVDTAGKPVQNATVQLAMANGQRTLNNQTGADGVVVFEPGAFSQFRLSVGPPPGWSLVDPAQASVPVAITAEHPDTTVRVVVKQVVVVP